MILVIQYFERFKDANLALRRDRSLGNFFASLWSVVMDEKNQLSDKKTIAFVVPSVSTIGGSIRVAISLANALSISYRVLLISLDGSKTPLFPIDSKVILAAVDSGNGRLRSRVLKSFSLLSKVIKSEKVNIVVGVGVFETLLCVLPALACRVPLVFCDHGALINQWDDKMTTLIRRIDMVAAKKVVVLTRKSESDYCRLFHAPADKITVIPNWISDDLRNSGREYDSNSKRLLWAGRLDTEKGVDLLCNIAACVMPNRPDWVWDVYGASVLSDDFDLESTLRKNGLADKVRLCGVNDNLWSVIHDYAVVTLTSYREGLPLILLEGLGAGLPLISFDVDTGPAEIIESGRNGYLVPCYDVQAYADMLDKLMSDVDLRSGMAAESKKLSQRFDERQILEKWLKLFSSLSFD